MYNCYRHVLLPRFWFMNLVTMFIFLRDIREGTVGHRLQISLDNFAMYRCRMSPLVAFAASNPIPLFYIAIAILSFTTEYVHSSYLIDICDTIWLIFLTASADVLPPLLNNDTRTSDPSRTISPSPSIRILFLHTPHQSLPHADEQGANYRTIYLGARLILEF